MKAERRHELKHNELSDWLGERMELLKPHATGIMLGLALLALILLGSVWYFGNANYTASTAWSQYFDAFNEREPMKALETLASDQAGGKASWWALATVADMHLGQGTALLYTDRAEAQKQLEQAKLAYQRVEAGPADPMLRNRAQLGLAKTYEALCQPEDARKYYDLVAANDSSTAIGKAAAEASARLKDPREVEFLAWFVKQAPKRPAPMPGIGGAIPNLPGTLSDRPDIPLSPGGLGLDNVGTGTPAEPAPSFPSPDSTAPKTESPPADKSADDKPADDKPAEAPANPTAPNTTQASPPPAGDKPAESKPEESKPAETKPE